MIRQPFVPALVREQVQRSPGALAVRETSVNGRSLTYAELWHAAKAFARTIDDSPVVALAIDRSAELVIAMLGAAVAGVPYLLLDPAAPASRHRDAMRAVGADSLYQAPGQSWWDLQDLTVTTIDLETLRDAVPPDRSLQRAGQTTRVMYYAATSGSTGTPKIIRVPHSSVITFLNDRRLCTVGVGKVMASISSPQSDATTMECFKPLVAGGTIAILPHALEIDVADWPQLIEDVGLTHLFLVSPLLEMLGRTDPSALRGLDVLMFGGDAIDPRIVAAILEHSRPTRLVQGYGPTEVTVFGACFDCETTAQINKLGEIPLGGPLEGYQMHILDTERLRPLDGAGIGEVWFAGDGVADGYLDTQLSGQRFRHPPNWQDQAVPMYQTGDLVRVNQAGDVFFHSRVDRQVKISGHRVELPEIERILMQTGLSDTCVVDVTPEVPPALVCFYVVRDDIADASSLRAKLAAQLPSILIPRHWVGLETMPLTSLGKVDRNAMMEQFMSGRDGPEA